VSTKHRLGKLPGAGPLAVDFAREVRAQGFIPLPISLEHGQVAGALVTENRDPFDRMLVAQAREEKLALVSLEERLEALGVVRIW
jgi:PIN domain nuclease of toxin-antitoxin system